MIYYVIRSGSWDNNKVYCRTVERFTFKPSNRYYLIGFRLIKKLKE